MTKSKIPNQALPSQEVPLNPLSQRHEPIVSLHDPWFEHKPSPGQSNSIMAKKSLKTMYGNLEKTK